LCAELRRKRFHFRLHIRPRRAVANLCAMQPVQQYIRRLGIGFIAPAGAVFQ
jgi:hypothetical protein